MDLEKSPSWKHFKKCGECGVTRKVLSFPLWSMKYLREDQYFREVGWSPKENSAKWKSHWMAAYPYVGIELLLKDKNCRVKLLSRIELPVLFYTDCHDKVVPMLWKTAAEDGWRNIYPVNCFPSMSQSVSHNFLPVSEWLKRCIKVLHWLPAALKPSMLSLAGC